MYQQRNQIIGLSVFDEQGEYIASVSDIVIDPERGKAAAILLGKGGFILPDRIIDLTDKKILISGGPKTDEASAPFTIKKIVGEDYRLAGSKVETIKGESLGRVKDYAMEAVNFKIKKLFVSGGILKDFIKGELIIFDNQIVEIKKERVVVKDILLKQEKKSPRGLAEAGI